MFILLAKLGGWELETYWQDDHPAQAAVREAIGAAFAVDPARIKTGIDGCGILTYAFPLREVARAFAILADPEALPGRRPRASLAPYYVEIRDAMIAVPGAGRRDARTPRHVADEGDERPAASARAAPRGCAAIGILRGQRNGASAAASGMAIKIEDGDGKDRGPWAATVEALRQVGVIEGQAQRVLARYHRPVLLDPHGRQAAEAIPEFELAPVGELVV